MDKYLGGGDAHRRRDQARPARRAASRARSCRCCAARRSRTRACRRCSTRSSITAVAVGPPAGQGHRSRTTSEATRTAADDEPFAALAFKILTDPFVGNLTFFRVYSGVLNSGDTVYNPVKDKQGAHRPPAADARQRARRDQGSPRGRHRRGRRPEGRHHRRHAVRPEQHHHAREDGLPRAGDLRWPSSRRPRPTRKRWASRCSVSRRKTRRSACAPTRSPGQTIISRHGRAAPRDHRRPHEARVQRRRERRQAAGRLSRDHPRGRREPKASSCASRGGRGQYGHVWLKIEPQAAGKGYEFVNGDRRRRRAAGIRPGGRQGRAGASRERRASAGYPVVDVKVTLFDGSYPRRRLERDGVQDRGLDRRSRMACARPSRSCSSPS